MSDEDRPEDYEKAIRRAIDAWKTASPSVVGYAVSVVLGPVGWLFSKVVPLSAIEAALSGLDWAAKNTLSAPASADAENLPACDRGADQVQNFHIALGAAQGGAAGALGLVGMIADVPAIVTLALRLIRQIGVEYGYAEDNEAERDFCLAVLQNAGSNTMAEKVASHATLQKIAVMISKETFKSMAAKAAGEMVSFEAAIVGVRSLAKQLGYNLTKRKMLEAIPVIGAVIGAATNGWFLRDVGLSAQRAFQERWLIERGRLIVDPE